MTVDLYPPVSVNSSRQLCTSASRPQFPYHGLEIFEIDTTRILVWDALHTTSARWVEIGCADADIGLHAFSPTWKFNTTAFTIGNGSSIGKFWYVGPNMVDVITELIIGSTTSGNGGTGALTFLLPTELVPFYTGDGDYAPLGQTSFIRSGVARTNRTAVWDTDSASVIFVDMGYGESALSQGTPFTFGVGDVVTTQMRYRATGV